MIKYYFWRCTLFIEFDFQPTPPKPKPKVSHQMKVCDMLDNLKSRQTVYEADLEQVLKNPEKYSKSFRNADTLLAQVSSYIVIVVMQFNSLV